jgi:ribonuclease VapC
MIASARAAVVDTSALVAILTREPDAERLLGALDGLMHRLVSAGTILELSLVLQARHGATADVLVDECIRDLRLDVVPFDGLQLVLARDGARRFGKGRHAAALNFGDLYAYALAMDRALPLLFVGGDFSLTDVEQLAI